MSAEPPLPRHPAPMTARVMEHVRTAIMEGTMLPGRLYSVYQLAEELGVSRSPVREGLLRLDEAGLVRFERNRGFRVVPTRPEDVAEIFAVRLALEVPAARRAAATVDAALIARIDAFEELTVRCATDGQEAEFFDRDQQLHDALLAAAGSSRGRDLVNRLRVSTRLLGASTAGDARTLGDIVAEHAPILAAIRAGDADAAGAAMAAHLRATGRLLVAQACRRQEDPRDPETIWSSMIVPS